MRISDWSSDVCSPDLAEQVGVNAPGTEKSATLRPLKKSSDCTCSGPFSVIFTKVVLGSLSPLLIVILSSVPREENPSLHRARKSVLYGQSVSVHVNIGGHGIINKKQ